MYFFFSSRRRHTRYIGDWSSDVCSSDLLGVLEEAIAAIRDNHSRGVRPEDAQIIDFTRQLLRRHRVDDATFKAMQSRFGNDELVQLTTAIGYYTLLSMTVNACELEPASGAEVLKV